MSIIKFRPEELASRCGEPAPVPEPLGSPLSQVRSHSITSSSSPRTRVGVWTCTPGRWRRQVVQAEFCHFLEGHCTFTPDGGEPIEVQAGDVLYFPARSTGVWDIRSTSHKIFIVFDEGTMQ